MNYLIELDEWDFSLLSHFCSLSQKIESCILQNNSVNIFEEYFEGLEPAPIVERSSAKTMYVYKDVETPTVSGNVRTLLWFLIKINVLFSDSSFHSSTTNDPELSYTLTTNSDQLVIYHGHLMEVSKLPSRTATRVSIALHVSSRPTRTFGRQKIRINRSTNSHHSVHRYV